MKCHLSILFQFLIKIFLGRDIGLEGLETLDGDVNDRVESIHLFDEGWKLFEELVICRRHK